MIIREVNEDGGTSYCSRHCAPDNGRGGFTACQRYRSSVKTHFACVARLPRIIGVHCTCRDGMERETGLSLDLSKCCQSSTNRGKPGDNNSFSVMKAFPAAVELMEFIT